MNIVLKCQNYKKVVKYKQLFFNYLKTVIKLIHKTRIINLPEQNIKIYRIEKRNFLQEKRIFQELKQKTPNSTEI